MKKKRSNLRRRSTERDRGVFAPAIPVTRRARLSRRETADLLGFPKEASIRALIKVGLLKPLEDPPEATETP